MDVLKKPSQDAMNFDANTFISLIDVTNGTLGNFVKLDDNNFTVDFTASEDGLCTAIINANTIVDSIGNVNSISGPNAGPYKWTREFQPPRQIRELWQNYLTLLLR